MPVATDWRPIATDVTYTDPVTGAVEYSLKWTQYDDDDVAIDLSADLAEGEIITDLECHLWRLHSTTESADTNSDLQLIGFPTVQDTTVLQRISGLTKDRVYRLFVEFGAPGNHRTVTAVIEVVG